MLDIPLEKLIGLCTDGESALIGKHDGLGAKLRRAVTACIVLIHCAAHRTALVMNNATDTDKWSNLDATLKAVHNLFNKSSKRSKAWSTFAKRHGLKALRFPVFNNTR